MKRDLAFSIEPSGDAGSEALEIKLEKARNSIKKMLYDTDEILDIPALRVLLEIVRAHEEFDEELRSGLIWRINIETNGADTYKLESLLGLTRDFGLENPEIAGSFGQVLISGDSEELDRFIGWLKNKDLKIDIGQVFLDTLDYLITDGYAIEFMEALLSLSERENIALDAAQIKKIVQHALEHVLGAMDMKRADELMDFAIKRQILFDKATIQADSLELLKNLYRNRGGYDCAIDVYIFFDKHGLMIDANEPAIKESVRWAIKTLLVAGPDEKLYSFFEIISRHGFDIDLTEPIFTSAAENGLIRRFERGDRSIILKFLKFLNERGVDIDHAKIFIMRIVDEVRSAADMTKVGELMKFALEFDGVKSKLYEVASACEERISNCLAVGYTKIAKTIVDLARKYKLTIDLNNAAITANLSTGFEYLLRLHYGEEVKKLRLNRKLRTFIEDVVAMGLAIDFLVKSTDKIKVRLAYLAGRERDYIGAQILWCLARDYGLRVELHEKEGRILGREGLEYVVRTYNGNIVSSYLQFVKDANLATDLSEIDRKLADIFYMHDLRTWVSCLNSDVFASYLPRTQERLRQWFLKGLKSDHQDLAYLFIKNLNLYYSETWTEEGVIAAVKNPQGAFLFVLMVGNKSTVWRKEPWAAKALQIAKKTVEQEKSGDGSQGTLSYQERYPRETQDLSPSDPYENDRFRFTAEKVRLAEIVLRLMRGKKIDDVDVRGKWGEEVIDSELIDGLRQVQTMVRYAYDKFLEKFRRDLSVPDEDKLVFSDGYSPVKLNSLLSNVEAFIARYLVGEVNGDLRDLKLELRRMLASLGAVLDEGFERYLGVYRVDIPLYDKLFDEFDGLRRAGDSPLEVYLGRDGIYAYIGRRAQTAVRRRRLHEGEDAFESDQVMELHPKYLVYPSYFRDVLTYSVKRRFLEQEGITKDSDPLFYDTGFSGTIPEQIMRIMGFGPEEIEERIRLLSSTHNPRRRLRLLSRNVEDHIINRIEDSAKTEQTAEGLFLDPKTGRIRHLAAPTNPEEQFYFMMIKQALARHYWIKERLRRPKAETANFDSEHYILQITPASLRYLPHDFVSQPETYLSAVVSSKDRRLIAQRIQQIELPGGERIIAHLFDFTDQDGARQDFSVCLAARGQGIPTIEPIGILFGKEADDRSLVLFKQESGVEGGRFRDYLRKLKKYVEEDIDSIVLDAQRKLEEVAKSVRERMRLGKRWQLKDVLVKFDEESDEVEAVILADWRGVRPVLPARERLKAAA